jgi:hypothetical protein
VPIWRPNPHPALVAVVAHHLERLRRPRRGGHRHHRRAAVAPGADEPAARRPKVERRLVDPPQLEGLRGGGCRLRPVGDDRRGAALVGGGEVRARRHGLELQLRAVLQSMCSALCRSGAVAPPKNETEVMVGLIRGHGGGGGGETAIPGGPC